MYFPKQLLCVCYHSFLRRKVNKVFGITYHDLGNRKKIRDPHVVLFCQDPSHQDTWMKQLNMFPCPDIHSLAAHAV